MQRVPSLRCIKVFCHLQYAFLRSEKCWKCNWNLFPRSESIEALRRSSDLGTQAGYQRRTREVLAWAKKRRRHIRREELISFLTGKNLPGTAGSREPHHRQRVGPRPRVCLEGGAAVQHHSHVVAHHTLPLVDTTGCADFEPALQSFREALSLPPFINAAASAKNAGRSRASNFFF